MDLPDTQTDSNSRELHDSILIDILVKLPLKSVITCKLVCKSWYDLISDSSFAQAYNAEEPFKCSLCFDSKSFYVNETGRGEIYNDLKLHLPTNKNEIQQIVGSCNGLFCFLLKPQLPVDKFEDTVYICNPLTCEYIGIPETGCAQSDVFYRMSYGFGRSTYSNRYKVVRFLPDAYRITFGSRIKRQVFTIGVDSRWRDLEGRCIEWTCHSYSVLFNGALHWVGFEIWPASYIIYAFNVEEEKGEIIELPLGLKSLEFYPFIGILNNHLCAVRSLHFLCVWIMKDYGVVESWTKYIFVKDPIPRHSFNWYPGFVCHVAPHVFAKEVEDMDPPVFARNGEKEHVIVGRQSLHDQALPYVPCFSSLNDVLGGSNLRVRKM